MILNHININWKNIKWAWEGEKRDDDDEAQINQLLTVHREQS